MKLLLKSAKIVDSASPYHLLKKDILLDNGIISSIEDNITSKAEKLIEFNNLHVSCGWFDSSVSFGEPGYEERETLENGLNTAMRSGFTSIILNPNTQPILDHSSLIKFVINASSNHIVDLNPCGALTKHSESKHLAELFDMYQSGAVAFGDYKKSISDSNLLKIALQYSKAFNGLIQLYPNDNDLSRGIQMHEGHHSTTLGLKGLPEMAEIIILQRDLEIIRYTKGKAHFSCISTKQSVDLIKKAKEDGLDVTCSVAIPNLIYTDEKLIDFDTRYKVFPPLRSTEDQEALIVGLKTGVIDMLTSDHNPINVELKKTEFEHAEFGSIGLESAFCILNKTFGLEQSIDFLTKGRTRFNQEVLTIKEGKPANLSLFDPDYRFSFGTEDIHSKSKNAIFLGEELQGKVYGIVNQNKYHVTE